MAVNINTVYQRVLTIANKEQRGYITPQEFNILANQAQMDIFEQYFYDQHQFSQVKGSQPKQVDPTEILKDKISLFETFNTAVSHGGSAYSLPGDTYRLSNVKYDDTIADYASIREFEAMKGHPLLRPHNNRPVYIKTKDGVKVYTGAASDNSVTQVTGSGVTVDYVKKPATAAWGYVVVSGSALYDSNNSTNFELHESEEVNLVNRILVLAGIMMKDPSLYQTAATEEVKDIQQEKQ
jgi:hypothetical protein